MLFSHACEVGALTEEMAAVNQLCMAYIAHIKTVINPAVMHGLCAMTKLSHQYTQACSSMMNQLERGLKYEFSTATYISIYNPQNLNHLLLMPTMTPCKSFYHVMK